MPPTPDSPMVGLGPVEWPDPPEPGTPPDPATLVGARTDADLAAALRPPPGHDPDAPVFVLFGSAWCTHCHDLLQAFDAARVQYGTAAGSGAPAQQQQQSGRWRLPWAWPGFWFRGGQEPTPTSSLPSPASSAPRFVAATVDFMGEAALSVRLTPTVAVYRRGARLDAWAGADGGKLADRVWLWAGARRGGVAGEVVVRK